MSQRSLNVVLGDGRFLLVLLLVGIEVSAGSLVISGSQVSGGCILGDLEKEIKELKQILVKDVGALTKKVDDLSAQNELQQKQLKNISGLLECVCSDEPPANVEEACKQAAADIVFALDASGSIGASNFQKKLDFVQDIVKMLDISGVSDGSTGSRVGLLTFDSTNRLQFHLNKYAKKDELLPAIKKAKYTGGGTNIRDAIRYVGDVMFQSSNGDRSTVSNYLVILTDVKASAPAATFKEAARARQRGIKIVAVGIGDQVNLKDLEALASPPSSANALFAADFTTLVDDVKNSLSMSICEQNNKPKPGPRDCADVMASGSKTSGVYTVYIGGKPVQVYCDMTTNGGGWLVFQRRQDGSVDFYRDWASYAQGFGSVNGEYWLGNENLHQLTSSRDYELRVDLTDFKGHRAYAKYTIFKVGSAAEKYKLSSLGKYSGCAGDSLRVQLGQKFSTRDQDNDIVGHSCAVRFKGAWWYKNCHHSNLNGKYLRGPHKSNADGVEWGTWRGWHYSLKFSAMKLRPK